MDFWITQSGEPYPFQKGKALMRTGLLAEELHRRGHSVTWWGSTFYHQLKQVLADTDEDIELGEGYRIKLLDAGGYSRNVSLKRYLYHRRLAKRFAVRARQQKKPDLLLASLPAHDLASEAVSFGRELDIPTIVDVRDMWPDNFVNRAPRQVRPVLKILLAADFRRRDKALSGASGITAVSREYLQWALKIAHRERGENNKVFYIGSDQAADLEKVTKGEDEIRRRFGIPEDRITASFIGTFGETYDLETVVGTARRELTLKNEKLHLVLAGDGQNFNKIRKMARGLENLTLTGWLGREQMAELLHVSDIGLAPYKENAPQSLPNKPFHYAAAGLPVVTSLGGEMEEIIRKYAIGEVFQAGDSRSLMAILDELAGDEKKRALMGRNARELFENKFYAGNIYREYADFLESFAQQPKV